MAAPAPLHVVFVHGLFSSAKVWTDFQQLIADDRDLAGVAQRCFEYQSPVFRTRVHRRIAEIDDVADRLRTYLAAELRDAESVVLVTHSQGGLVVQRFLARTLAQGRGRELSRIKHIAMFACPNSGSEFFLSLRRALLPWRHPQERQLRPFVRAVTESQQTVLRAVVNAQGCSDTECRIPISAYGGMSDAIVPPSVSTWVFPDTGVVDGDHFSIVRPADRSASSYQVLKNVLRGAAEVGGTEVRAPAPEPVRGRVADERTDERQARVSVSPPFGQLDAPLQGRDDLVRAIMSSGEKSRVQVLAGLGGSGKSRLALEIAYRAQHAGRRVWWVSVPQINLCMREVANQLGAPENQMERAWQGAGSATDLVWRLLDASPDPWLLVFDNADDPQRLGPLDGPVSDGTGWLRKPATSKGAVIVTSRDRRQATWGTWSTVHPVLPLAVDDGAAMLMDRSGEVGGTYEQARLLSAELGGLPLALRAAADYVKSVGSTLVWSGRAGITDFESYRAAVRRRFESPPGAYSRDLNEPLGLELAQGVFDLSLDLLAQRGLREAAPLLKLFACLNVAPIPYRVLLGSDVLAQSPLFTDFTEMKRVTVLDALADLGLIEPHMLKSRSDPALAHVLSLHPLVHGILRDDEDVQRHRGDYYGLNVQLLLAATRDFDPDYAESWGIWDIVAPHALEVARAALLGPEQLADRRVVARALELARLATRYLVVTGLLGPAHDLVTPIIADCASFGFQRSDREILALRHEAGRIALERGDPRSAEAEFRQVIAERTRILGENHADTLASRHKLAKAIFNQGRWAEAEPVLRAVVLAENEVRGPEHADTMVVRHSLASAILALGRAAEAEEMLRDILRVRDSIWPPTTPETLHVRQTLARSLLAQSKAAEAETEIRDALRQAGERRDSPIAMYLRYILCTVLLVFPERVSELVEELNLLLKDRRRVLGPTHPETERTAVLLSKAQLIPHPRTGGEDRATSSLD